MADKTGIEAVWDLRIQEVAKALEHNKFRVTVLDNLKEAVAFFETKLLPELGAESAYVGGSETVTHSGVYDILRKKFGAKFINPYDKIHTPESSLEARRQGLLSDLFVTSSNALLREGHLLNLDGNGNRVAALCFGPKNVILFVGRNKICEDLEGARQRVKEFAAVANALRLKRKTPCTVTGSCAECNGTDRICNTWVLTEKSSPAGRIHVLLINEDLGF